MNRTKPYGAAVPKPFDFRIACEVGLSVTSRAWPEFTSGLATILPELQRLGRVAAGNVHLKATVELRNGSSLAPSRLSLPLLPALPLKIHTEGDRQDLSLLLQW